MKFLIREVAIYATLLIILMFIVHPDLLASLDRISLMIERKNYFHPFIYTFFIYILLSIIRFVISKFIYFFKK